MRNPLPSYDDLRYENLIRKMEAENLRLRREMDEIRSQAVTRGEFKMTKAGIVFAMAIFGTGLIGVVLYLVTRR